MNKRLIVEMELFKVVKDAQNNDVHLKFVLQMPANVPFDLADEVVAELAADLKDWARASKENADKMKAEQDAKSEPTAPEIVEN